MARPEESKGVGFVVDVLRFVRTAGQASSGTQGIAKYEKEPRP